MLVNDTEGGRNKGAVGKCSGVIKTREHRRSWGIEDASGIKDSGKAGG